MLGQIDIFFLGAAARYASRLREGQVLCTVEKRLRLADGGPVSTEKRNRFPQYGLSLPACSLMSF
jgi:hypothetical protein